MALQLLQEMCIKIRAMGFLGHRGYLDVRKARALCFSLPRLPLTRARGAAQDAWNKLDFIVVFSSWINITVELFEFDLGIGASPDPAFQSRSKADQR